MNKLCKLILILSMLSLQGSSPKQWAIAVNPATVNRADVATVLSRLSSVSSYTFARTNCNVLTYAKNGNKRKVFLLWDWQLAGSFTQTQASHFVSTLNESSAWTVRLFTNSPLAFLESLGWTNVTDGWDMQGERSKTNNWLNE